MKCIVDMRKCVLVFLLCIGGVTAYAQTANSLEQQTIVGTVVEEESVVSNEYQVITNYFRNNWFVVADAGINAYWADYNSKGSLASRLTPQFNVGFGKWFVPGFGAKLQFTGFRSRADKWCEGYYTHASEQYTDSEGNPYWKERVKWFNFNFSIT